MITQIISLFSWPVLIYISYVAIKYFIKKLEIQINQKP